MEEERRTERNKWVIISDESVVRAGDELLPLCAMCKKSKLVCDNPFIRLAEVPMEESDDPQLEIIDHVRQEDNTTVSVRTGLKFVDGVEEEVYKIEKDMPDVFACQWFSPKDPG